MAGYLVLARKYRPKVFDDVLGQGTVTGVLRGALREGRIGHAYIFSGPRGTGKTTTARIFARCLNCAEGPTDTPCGACEQCLGIDAGTDPDLIEIDAATHTGVDSIRSLREQTAFAPMKARHKVYIIDEVHMLSKPAFNALLKTLEEPPEHVVFLFATTEFHKILPTITSRCQVLKLAALAEEEIIERLRDVLKQEGVTHGPGLLEEVARGADGGMRDALSLMDKLLALAGDEPTLEDLRRLGGHASARESEELLALVEAGDKRGVIEAVARHEGTEAELISSLLHHLRLSLVARLCGDDSPLLPTEDEARSAIAERARRLKGERVELWMQELLHARERMRGLPGQEKLVAELTLLDLARPETTLTLAELEARLLGLEGGGAPMVAPATPAPSRAPSATPSEPTPAPEQQPTPEPPAARGPETAPAPPVTTSAGSNQDIIWQRALGALSERHAALGALLRDRGKLHLDGDKAVVEVVVLDPAQCSMVEDRRNSGALRRALERFAGTKLDLTIKQAGVEDEPPQGAEEQPKTAPDPFTQEVAGAFGGVIEDLQ